MAGRPAGRTGGDRCLGGPDLFLQEECKELIVSLPGSDLSTALPGRVERTYQWAHVTSRWAGGRPGPVFLLSLCCRAPSSSGHPGLGNTASGNSATVNQAPRSFSLVDCWRDLHLAPSSPLITLDVNTHTHPTLYLI